jgi:hypothetical protein
MLKALHNVAGTSISFLPGATYWIPRQIGWVGAEENLAGEETPTRIATVAPTARPPGLLFGAVRRTSGRSAKPKAHELKPGTGTSQGCGDGDHNVHGRPLPG